MNENIRLQKYMEDGICEGDDEEFDIQTYSEKTICQVPIHEVET